MPEATAVRIGLIFWTGSLDDPEGKEGLAHLFEHMPFRGTKRFRDKFALTAPLERVGGHLNAYTDLTNTFLYAEVPSSNALIGFEALFDLAFFPLLHAKDLEAERNVIEAEIARKENSMSFADNGRMMRDLFGRTIGSKSWVLGTRQTLATITDADLRAFHESHYAVGNVEIIVVGNARAISYDLLEFFQRAFGKLPVHSKPRRSFTVGELRLPDQWETRHIPTTNPQILIRGPLHESHAKIAQGNAERDWALGEIVRDILIDRGLSSVLYQVMRESQQLTYSLSTSGGYYDLNFGMWNIHAFLKRSDDVQMFLDLLEQTLVNPNTFSDVEIAYAKTSIIGAWDIYSSNIRHQFNLAASSLRQLRRLPTQNEMRRNIREATRADVMTYVKHYLFPDHWTTMVMLPT
jgi:predicted Zn-dependent peptidase